MATEFSSLSSLKSLIVHHIALINRFSAHSFEEFALLFLKMDDFDDIDIIKSIQIVFRNTDIIFEHNNNYIILLPKTDWNGASKLLEGLQEFLDQEFQDSIITYPDDGKNEDELLATFKKVIKRCYDYDLQIL